MGLELSTRHGPRTAGIRSICEKGQMREVRKPRVHSILSVATTESHFWNGTFVSYFCVLDVLDVLAVP